jgi:hypothetical protein
MSLGYTRPLRELQRLHGQVHGADLAEQPQLEHQLPGSVGLHSLVGLRRVGDSAPQLLDRLTIIGNSNAQPRAG